MSLTIQNQNGQPETTRPTTGRRRSGLRVMTRVLIAAIVGSALLALQPAPSAMAAQNGELIYVAATASCDPLSSTMNFTVQAMTTRSTNETIWYRTYVQNASTLAGWWSDWRSFTDNRVIYQNPTSSWDVSGTAVINPNLSWRADAWTGLGEGKFLLYTEYAFFNGSQWVTGGVWTTSYTKYYYNGYMWEPTCNTTRR